MNLSRIEGIICREKLNELSNKRILLFGIGGVGGFIAESLIRSGIKYLSIVDGDIISETNINRQIIALSNNVGMLKTQAMKERLLSINPDALIKDVNMFYLPENADKIDFSSYDYVIDAVDTVSAKIEIIKRAKENGIPIISCMGTGGKTDITKLKVSDISKTEGCPLARVMRRELKNRNIKNVKVVYSDEKPIIDYENEEKTKCNRPVPTSMIFVPASAGLLIASEVIKDLINI